MDRWLPVRMSRWGVAAALSATLHVVALSLSAGGGPTRAPLTPLTGLQPAASGAPTPALLWVASVDPTPAPQPEPPTPPEPSQPPPPQPPPVQTQRTPGTGGAGTLYLRSDEVDIPATPYEQWTLPAELSGLLTNKVLRVNLWINTKGQVDQVEMVDAEVPPALRERVVDMMRATTFEPAVKGGRRVANFRQIEIATAPRGGMF